MSAPTFSSFPARPIIAHTSLEEESQPQAGSHRTGSRRAKDRSFRPHRKTGKPSSNAEKAGRPSSIAESSLQALQRDNSSALPSSEYGPTYRDVVFDKTRFKPEYSLNAPSYRRRTHHVVGLPTFFKVDHGKGHRGIELGSRQSQSDRTRLPLEPPPAKIRRLAAQPVEFDQQAPFVGFGARPKAEVSDDEFEIEFSDLPRSDAARQLRVSSMEQQLRREPDNIAGWLRYSTLHLPPTIGDPLDGPFDQASAEVSLAILESAIALNNDAELHLAYIRVARHIQTPTQISAEWASVLRVFPLPGEEALTVWIAYLGWCETDGFGTFDDIEEIVAIYSRVIESLRRSMLDQGQGGDSTALYLLLRVAKFLRNAGYEERSFALFQALMEITFFKPTHLITSTPTATWWDSLLGDFQLFWDSESPRFGELGSMGWKNGICPLYVPKQNTVDSDDWYTQELGQLPDPYSVVLFEDIRPLLIPLVSPESRLQAVHALLNILGVPIVPPDGDLPPDPFLYTDCAVNWPKPERVHPWVQTPTAPRLHDISFRSWAFDIDTLFTDPSEWFSFAKAPPPDPDLARRCLTQIQPLMPDPRFSVMILSFDRSLKRAKAMLSQDRTNLNMWYAYAAFEIGRHRYDSARSVFANALSFAKSQRAEAGEDELDLLAGWVQLESDLGEKARAVDLLMLAASYGVADFLSRIEAGFVPPTPTATQLLRAGQYFDAHSRLAYFYSTLVREESASTTSDEAYLQFLCRQLWLDSSKLAFRQLTSTVNTAVGLFPNNTLFQTLRLMVTERQSVRAAERMIDNTLSTSIIHVVWGIGEMARLAGSSLWKSDGSGAGRLRDLFQRAIRTNHGRQSSAVWKIYIEFESMMDGSIVKQLCYRAVAAVGSCKDLYLLPFSPSLRNHFNPQELRDWLLLMVERGVRVRVPFEHLLDVDDSPELPSDEELEDDELGFLREAQRLKPYE